MRILIPVYTRLRVGVRMTQHRKLTSKGRGKSGETMMALMEEVVIMMISMKRVIMVLMEEVVMVMISMKRRMMMIAPARQRHPKGP